jgi:hypothetical protein
MAGRRLEWRKKKYEIEKQRIPQWKLSQASASGRDLAFTLQWKFQLAMPCAVSVGYFSPRIPRLSAPLDGQLPFGAETSEPQAHVSPFLPRIPGFSAAHIPASAYFRLPPHAVMESLLP